MERKETIQSILDDANKRLWPKTKKFLEIIETVGLTFNPSTKAHKRRIRRLAVLKEQLSEAQNELTRLCPHPPNEVVYKQHDSEDDWSRQGTTYHSVVCESCGRELTRWNEGYSW